MNRPTHRAALAAALAFGPVPAALACSPNPYVGQVCTVAQDWCPAGTLPADGRLLPIRGNEPLYTVLGMNYGGDGIESFALPDLRGRVVAHQGQGPGLASMAVGEALGSDSISVAVGVDNLPPHTHPASSTADITATLRGQRAQATLESPSGATLAAFRFNRPRPKGTPGPTDLGAYSSQAANVDMYPGSIVAAANVKTTTGPAGGGKPLDKDNAQPTLVLRQCIAVVGQYPQYPPAASTQPATPRQAASPRRPP
jgi:microcystin-dependent protein